MHEYEHGCRRGVHDYMAAGGYLSQQVRIPPLCAVKGAADLVGLLLAQLLVEADHVGGDVLVVDIFLRLALPLPPHLERGVMR